MRHDPAPGAKPVDFAPATDDIRLDISATVEADSDGDGLGDETQDADDDADGVDDLADNCPTIPNTGQANADGDAQGDACDDDDDNDGVPDTSDNCPTAANASQADFDGDAKGDACDDSDEDGVVDAIDNCVTVANAGQADADRDGQGDVCDSDDDNDGVADVTDRCPLAAGPSTNQGCPVPQPLTPVTLADTTRPVLSLRLSPSKFRRTRATTVKFSLSEKSSLKLTVERKSTGRRVGGKCRSQTGSNRSKKRCTRWVTVKGSVTTAGEAGSNSLKFRGVGSKKLKTGSYRLNGRATDAAGNRSSTKRKSFKVVK